MAYLLILVTMIAIPFLASLVIAVAVGSLVPFLAQSKLKSTTSQMTYLAGSGIFFIGIALISIGWLFASRSSVSASMGVLVGLTTSGLLIGWVVGLFWFRKQVRKRDRISPIRYWKQEENTD
ncbi:MAG: hypothetical protein AAGA89_05100 [Pseudomonadota bacterium]